MDLYPDSAIRAGLLSEKGLFARFLTALSRFSLNKADAVVVIGRCTQDLLQSDGLPVSKLSLIPNWINDSMVQPIPANENQLRREWGLTGRFVVFYSGNMGTPHFFDDILETARRLQRIDDIRFVFVGDGARRKEIEAAKAKYELTNVLLFPYQPMNRLSESLSVADIHYVCLRNGFEGTSVPSKAYGALAVGKPLLYQGAASGEIARMVLEEKIGSVVPPHEPAALTQSVLHYYQHPGVAKAEGDRARQLNELVYNREHSIESYLALFRRFESWIEEAA